MYTDNLQRLEDAMVAADMAWWEVEFPSGTMFFSENKTRMLGYKDRNFFHYTDFTDLVHPDDLPHAVSSMRRLMAGESDTYETTYRIRTASGSYVTFHDRGKLVSRRGEEFSVAGIVRLVP